MKITNIISILLIITSFFIAIFFYDKMPELMASHWNIKWGVDGYMTKTWWLYLMPIISVFIYILYLIIPKIDPLKENIKKFRTCFDNFILVILLFLFYIYSLTIYWNLWYMFKMNLMILPALSILFFYMWILLSHAKRNWFIWIRTPWTLSSDIVWEKTHKLAWTLFKILAILSLFWIFLWNYAFYFVIIPTIFFIVSLIIYSYVEYWDEVL
jgi:uncharacterized membrane protein